MSNGRNRLMKNYGWVQNTSNLSTIRDTVDLVPDYGIVHLDLREAIRESREQQGNLPNRWTWDARCRIKAIHATGLVQINRAIKGYELTDLGRELKKCPIADEYKRGIRVLSDEEKAVFRRGLLTNPPVVRVLTLLNEDMRGAGHGLSKYDIGVQLGFAGDIGFTHHDPNWVARNNYSFNDKEGDADKWARTILSWLSQVDWVIREGHQRIEGKRLSTFRAFPVVENVLRYDAGRITRNVPIEMLCSDHHPYPKLIQKRRSIILRELANNSQVTVAGLIDALSNEEVETTETVVQFELVLLCQAGFMILEDGGYYGLQDRIIVDAPAIEDVEEPDNVTEALIEENVVRYQDTIPGRVVDGLIRYGYNGSMNNEFEEKVGEYFKFLGYNVDQQGQGRGRVADVIAKYVDDQVYARSYGIIIDAKATSRTYGFSASDKRKMKEYINKHGRELAQEAITHHAFSFISSRFVQDVEPHLQEVARDTHVNGVAINVLTLLALGDRIRSGQLQINGLYNSYITNSNYELH